MNLSKFTFLLAPLAGLLFPIGLAPFNHPGLLILSISIWFYLLEKSSVRECAKLSLWYGIAKYSLGLSWVYVSIDRFSELPWFFSICITLAFIILLSFYEVLIGFIFAILKTSLNKAAQCALFSALATLGEILRSSLFSGLPWLLSGHSQLTTPLQNLAPIIGSIGLSFICYLIGSFLANALFIKQSKDSINYRYAIMLILPFVFIPLTLKNNWVSKVEQPLKVSLLQGNISHNMKWETNENKNSLITYTKLTNQRLSDDLIVWPETALTTPNIYADDIFKVLKTNAREHNSDIILGAPGVNENNTVSNSIFLLGKKSGRYDKQHLVPFGEYMPMPILNDIYRWFNVPFANLSKGKHINDLFKVKNLKLAPFICFEIAFTNKSSLARISNSQLLLTITDDSWFGNSFAKAQHLQIAQMRSLESGREQLFTSNDGLTALINHKGKIIKQLPPNQTSYLHGIAHGYKGNTPFINWGQLPTLLLSCLIVLIILITKFWQHK